MGEAPVGGAMANPATVPTIDFTVVPAGTDIGLPAIPDVNLPAVIGGVPKVIRKETVKCYIAW